MLFKLLGAPVSVPIAGIGFVFRRLIEMAETELYDESRIREDLLLLQLQLEEGEIGEDEFVVREKDIMARLRAAREYRLQQAGAAGNTNSIEWTGGTDR